MSSPADATAASAMPAWGKSALLVGLLFIGCWGAAILYWRMTDRMPTAGELAFCLVGAPLLVTSGVWLSRRMLEQRAAPSPAPAAAATRVAEHRGLLILDSALRLPCGSSAEEVYSAIRSNKARPDLDRELLDDDGFPVMTARCMLADDEGLRDEIAEWMAANGFANAEFVDEHWRALVLATQVVDDLLSSTVAAGHSLQLRTIGPDWPPAQRRASDGWLTHKASQCGLPTDRITIAQALPEGDPNLALIESHLAQADDAPGLTLLLAFASNIGNETVSRWSDNGTLFTPANADGQIPGEGAAGLLLANPQHHPPDAGRRHATFTRVETEAVDIADVKSKRGDPQQLASLAGRACDRCGIASSRITAIAADTGHRPNQVLEIMGLAAIISSELDAQDDVIRIGTAAGTCGGVPALAGIALAAHCATERRGPALWACNSGHASRDVAIVCPPSDE